MCYNVDEDVLITSQYCRQELTSDPWQRSDAIMPSSQQIQSEETTDTESTEAVNVAQQQIVFRDASLSQRLTMGSINDSFTHDHDDTASLGEFLSRPVKISTFNWDVNNTSWTTSAINPWTLYFNHVSIKRKIQNFARLNCKLNIKFVINASPFYYGSLRACYQPLADERSSQQQDNDKVCLSQMPGVYLEPQNMTTAEMELPWVWQANYIDTKSLSSFDYLGKITYVQFQKLLSANGVSTGSITINVFAWASDVTLMGPTDGPVIQSDEYSTEGSVSGPATAIANVAEKLSDVPMIGEYASATAIGARAISGIAKLFGYSNPPVIDDVKPMHNKSFHAFANVETRMPIDKLALDPKNEVTISSTAAGIDEPDPLAYQNLLTRESFVQGTLYSGTQAAETLLWSTMVSPHQEIDQSGGGGAYKTFTPVGYFGHLFRLWRGTMIYKFRFIKSKYHKGRVTITWDPNHDITANVDSDATCFTRIVDIENEDEVEISIPYRGITPYLEVENTPTAQFSNGPTPSLTFNRMVHNGCLTMRVQNVLTGPAATPEIAILVYARAGEDFQYAVPREIRSGFSTRDPTGVIQSEEESITQNTGEPDSNLAMITTGEVMTSLRPLLHRTSLSHQQYMMSEQFTGLQHVICSMGLYRYPLGTGRSSKGYFWTNDTPKVRYNYVANHPIDFVANCFMGIRGSTTIAVSPAGSSTVVPHLNLDASRLFSTPNFNAFSVANNVVSTFNGNADYGSAPRNSITSQASVLRVTSGLTGMSLTNTDTQAGLLVNLPQLTKLRFMPAFFTKRTFDFSSGVDFYDEAIVRASFVSNAADGANFLPPMVRVYYAAGVDFQPIMFICTPRVWNISLPQAANTYP
jgi:hypothetical protein